MPGLEALTNPYDRRARLYPMVLTLLPIALGIASWAPPDQQLRGVLTTTLVALALSSFLTQLARDLGKRREPSLFRLWGGRPSDLVLSYQAGVFPPATLARRHRVLRALDPELKFPESAKAEKESPEAFAAVYSAATDLLLARTRDRAAFPLLFEENMNYGFRRNLWGMKQAGFAASILGLVASATRLAIDLSSDRPFMPAALGGTAICAALISLWSLRVTPSWVRIPADAFARQLAECCDRLTDSTRSST